MANLMDLFIRVGIDDQATGKIGGITSSFSKVGSSIGKGLATAAKVGTAALTAVGTAAVGVAKSSIDAYAEYEQLVGGAQLMFGEAYEFVASKSANAYKTVQMSQNDYLQQMNGFATGLKTALGGDEQAAAELADRILQAEADVVAATGNTQEAVQNAFNGIMKSNFTMLDNLQLGITPTKEGFQELIASVNKWNAANGKSTKYTIGNLADMQSALVDYIEMQGLAGYASKEASQTISGSVAAMKGSWQNLMVGMSDDSQSIDVLVDNFADSVETVADNIFPVVERLVPRMGEAIGELAKTAIDNFLPDISADEVGQKLLDFVSGGVEEALPESAAAVMDGLVLALNAVEEYGPGAIDAAGEVGGKLLGAIMTGMTGAAAAGIEGMPALIDALGGAFEANSDALANVGGEIMAQIVLGMVDSAEELGEATAENGGDILSATEKWLNPDKAGGVADKVAGNFVGSFAGAMEKELPHVWEVMGAVFDSRSPIGFKSDGEGMKLPVGVEFVELEGSAAGALAVLYELFTTPLPVNGDFEDFLSKAQDAYNSIVSTFSKEVTIKANVEVSGGAGFVKNVTDRNTGKVHASAASGLDYVPFDGYVSMLHKDEAVLTANQAKKWRAGASGGVTIVQHINSVPQTPVQLAAATAAYFERARW